MTSARIASLVVGSALATTWLVSAAVTRQGGDPVAAIATPQTPAQTATTTDDLQVQAARLHERLDAAPTPRRSSRNPFRFGSAVERPAAPSEQPETSHAASVPAPEPASVPPPPLRLVGIASADGAGGAVRTAALSVAGVVVLVRPGDEVAGRYRVTAVSADVVELTDRLGGPPLRLAIR